MRRVVLSALVAATLLFWPASPAIADLLDSYHKSDPIQNLPDFGQVSQNWCWAAAAANSLYWYAKHGYPEILDDPNNPGPDQNLDGPGGVGGTHKLVEEVARIANVPFSTPIYKSNYLNALNNFLIRHGVHVSVRPSDGLYVHDLMSDPIMFDEYGGPYSDPFQDPDPSAPEPEVEWEEPDPLVVVEFRNPTFDDLRRELGRSQDVLLWLSPDGNGISHVVTAEGWEKDPTSPTGWKVFISDPWTPDPPGPGPDNNTDPNRASHESYQVLSTNPFRIAYGNQKNVFDMIYVSPVPEPGTCVMLVFAGLMVLATRRRWSR